MLKRMTFINLFIYIFLGFIVVFSQKNEKQDEKKPDYIFEEIDPFLKETDVSKLINIKDENDIIRKRNGLINLIWSGNGFPNSKMPGLVENDFKDERYNDFTNLNRIDKLTVIMDWGFRSITYLFHP